MKGYEVTRILESGEIQPIGMTGFGVPCVAAKKSADEVLAFVREEHAQAWLRNSAMVWGLRTDELEIREVDIEEHRHGRESATEERERAAPSSGFER